MNDKKHYKIMFVASDNSAISGAFRSMVALAALLRDEFHHEVLVVLPYEGNGKELLDEKGIENIIIRSYNWTRRIGFHTTAIVIIKDRIKYIISLMAAYKIRNIAKRKSFDLIQINATDSYVGALAALRSDIPFIWHIREFFEEDHGVQIINPERGYALIRKANKIIVISKSLESKYARIMGSDKVTTIYNGLDPSTYKINYHEILNGEEVNVLMVGSISESKGQCQAIHACINLHRKGYTNIMLRLVGRGNEEYLTELKSTVADAGAEEYIKFCGPTNDTVSFYREADIFLMCSRAEAFGRVTVEAMMGGCLAIGANSMATAELIEDGETGYLYESGDINDLTDKIEYAITHKEESRRLANAGREYMINNMTALRNAEQVDALYRKILRGGSG